ncbi:MAG TPA: HU family DNA-binding protein [Gammaproteobacteria bacterium]|nr:HU family DNA-binding protein [Gammaproteobacteria bacterium]
MSNAPGNKAALIEWMAQSSDISKTAATKALNAVIDGITQALREGNSVAILGFGTFMVKTRAERTGRNPKTGEPIKIAAANIPSFKAGKALKDAVNSGSVVVEEEV